MKAKKTTGKSEFPALKVESENERENPLRVKFYKDLW